MATTKNTKSTTETTKAKRETVELPNLTVEKSSVELSDKVTRKRENPMLKAVAAANADRQATFSVKGIVTEKQANKVIRLLVDAGRKQESPCSVRVKYDADTQVVLFKAVDLVTRTKKAK